MRTAEGQEKEGIFTGKYATNPLTGERVPIYVANFVLMEYGTGAIMAVPAHDQRDFEFAKKYDIPIKTVIRPDDAAPISDDQRAPIADWIAADCPADAQGMTAAFTEPGVHFEVGGGDGPPAERSGKDDRSVPLLGAQQEGLGVEGREHGLLHAAPEHVLGYLDSG